MKAVNRVLAATGALLLTVAMTVGTTPLPAQASRSHPSVVSENPADNTPQVVLGTSAQTVYAFAQIGPIMFVGGRFSQVQNPARTITYSRQNFFAFDANTGEVVTSINYPSFDNMVQTLVPSADGKAIYIGGSFKKVDGVARPAIVKYDLITHQIDPTFNAPTNGGTVADAQLVGGRLIVAGTLAKSLLALNPTTGADTGYINLNIAGVINQLDITKVRRFAVDPAGSKLVAVGNFSTVNGQLRRWTFELTLGATTSALNTWHPSRLDVPCINDAKQNVGQDVDFSPDGTYFVIATTGGPSGDGGLCDAAGRYRSADIKYGAGATWANFTGGDSLYSVAATGAAVYVGGHARWLDNPQGDDSKGPGAVDRPGIGAIDPVTGKANSWNPTKDRNHGVETMYATSTGLWVGSDGVNFANEVHSGIAFCPLPK